MTQTGDNFDPYASEYDNLLSDSLGVAGGDRAVYAKYKTDFVAAKIPDGIALKVLDFGCGDGISLELLRSKKPSWSLYGIDISAESVHIANNRAIPDCVVSSFDGVQIPYQNETFSVIFVANVMHHIPFELHADVIKEFHRVLTPGGQLFVFEHNPFNPVTQKIFRDCIFDQDAKMLPPNYLKKSLQSVGLKQKKTSYHLFFPRHWIFYSFIKLESFLSWFPLGGQYCAWFEKDKSSSETKEGTE